jgi:hypothetical protein
VLVHHELIHDSPTGTSFYPTLDWVELVEAELSKRMTEVDLALQRHEGVILLNMRNAEVSFGSP